ncbi:MAG: hypothetical protein ACI4EI_05315 [Muricoprocola sp.]
MSVFGEIQPAVKKETKRVTVMTGSGLFIMLAGFFVLHMIFPDNIPFDYTVVLAGIVGSLVAVGNFFFMGLAVQKVAATTDEEAARTKMKASYSQRMMAQMLWVVLAIVLPCFQFAAGIIPLLFPSIGIKIMGILKKN